MDGGECTSRTVATRRHCWPSSTTPSDEGNKPLSQSEGMSGAGQPDQPDGRGQHRGRDPEIRPRRAWAGSIGRHCGAPQRGERSRRGHPGSTPSTTFTVAARMTVLKM
ncbi:hypothetical protein QJS66_12895 [Kocuria rhizophila]|nr:hypothetical protein QJS66_12895 [Kocuria rhizophila]